MKVKEKEKKGPRPNMERLAAEGKSPVVCAECRHFLPDTKHGIRTDRRCFKYSLGMKPATPAHGGIVAEPARRIPNPVAYRFLAPEYAARHSCGHGLPRVKPRGPGSAQGRRPEEIKALVEEEAERARAAARGAQA